MNKNELLSALKTVIIGIEKQNNALGMDFIIFDDEYIRSFKDKISVSFKFPTGIKCGIRGEELYKALEKIPSDEIEMKVDGNKLVITSGKITIRMNLLQSGALDNLLDKICTLDLDNIEFYEMPKAFMEGMKLSLFSSTKKASSNELNGMLYEENYILATNDRSASMFVMEEYVPSRFLIPAEACESILRLPNKFYAVTVTPGWVHLKEESEGVISVRLISDTNYPCEGVLNLFEKKKQVGKPFVFPKGMKEVLERAEIFAGGDSNILIMDHIVLTRNKKELIVTATKEAGEIVERIPWEKDQFPEGAEIRVSPTLLKLILSVTSKCVIGPNNSAIVFETENFSHVILSKVNN